MVMQVNRLDCAAVEMVDYAVIENMWIVLGERSVVPAKEVLPGEEFVRDIVSFEVVYRPNGKVARHGGLGQGLRQTDVY